MNGLTLAYIGDAYYELYIREYLIESGITNVDKLHQRAIRFTSGIAQSKIITHFIDNNIINQDEIDAYKRGRNASGPGRKNIDAKTYHQATGFESLIGYLYTNKQFDRLTELLKQAIEIIEKGDTYGKG